MMDAPLGLPESSCRFIGSRRTTLHLPRRMRLAVSGTATARNATISAADSQHDRKNHIDVNGCSMAIE